jgi:hypothetical protein
MKSRSLEPKAGSCPKIVFINGERAAVPFKLPMREVKPPTKSSNISEAKETYKTRQVLHLGMKAKPLMPYSPDSHRSRLPLKQFQRPDRNSSSFSMGDSQRSQQSRQFITTSQAMLRSPHYEVLTNPGILSDLAKWRNSRMYL